ncbi:MAG: hypothetical protein RIC56_02705 [Pseudomonadales bacterium]
MEHEEQKALLRMWANFLAGRRPSGPLMREFYFNVVAYSSHYRYGLAPELFDLILNGLFDIEQSASWSLAQETAAEEGDHRAA